MSLDIKYMILSSLRRVTHTKFICFVCSAFNVCFTCANEGDHNFIEFDWLEIIRSTNDHTKYVNFLLLTLTLTTRTYLGVVRLAEYDNAVMIKQFFRFSD